MPISHDYIITVSRSTLGCYFFIFLLVQPYRPLKVLETEASLVNNNLVKHGEVTWCIFKAVKWSHIRVECIQKVNQPSISAQKVVVRSRTLKRGSPLTQ